MTNTHISVLLKSMSRDQTEKRKRRNSLELSNKRFSWNMKPSWRNFTHDIAIYIERPETVWVPGRTENFFLGDF